MLKRSTKRIHFIGIGGAGVSALAHLMLDREYEVTGSDRQSSKVTRALEEAGAQIWYEHDERYVRHADLVVRSTAITDENPEVIYAKQSGVALLSRIEFMAYLAADRKRSVVISGSHGKSTTTSMVASISMAAQLDPTVVIGSVLKQGLGSARHGKSDIFICEGDESNNSMLSFNPHVAVVTNIDYDHMDFHGSLSNLKNSFVEFLNSPGRDGLSIVCLDDENVRSIMPLLKGRVITYGTHPEAEYQATNRRLNREGGLSFEVHHRTEGPLGVVNLRYPGDHNMQNALCSLVVCRSLGVSTDTCSYGLETFPGIHRRYDILHAGSIHVIDDYAHHPTEIQNLLGSVREVFKGRIRVIFQPHRYTRSRNLAQQFPPAFINADEIILAPIYTANEKPMAGIGLDYLNRFFQAKYDESRLRCINGLDEIYEYVINSSRPGDVILTVGAGTVNTVGYRLAEQLERKEAELVSGVDLERISAEMSETSFLMDEQG